jgi:nicotinate-nucleotide pyrophosphorylase (carboxylating)
MPEPPRDLAQQVEAALREDIGSGDVTAALVPAGQRVRGSVVTREHAILAGRPWAEAIFRRLDPQVQLTWHASDGEPLAAKQVVFEIAGAARAILTGERTALNFLQLLSATATATQRFVQAIAGTPGQILDTRKTLPGLRSAQKYAVVCGGGRNHRMGLYDRVLIKENHIAAAGGIAEAISRARSAAPELAATLEVEVRDGEEIEQALAAGAPRLLLDNMVEEELRAAVAQVARRAELEASGNVTLQTLRGRAETGVDWVSMGALTHSAPALDLSLTLKALP